MRKSMSVRSVCLATLCALCLPAVAQEAEEAEWQQITVGGETRYVMPNEVARGLGIPRQDVPDEENAAWVYIQAFNALPEEPAQGNISPLRRRGEPRTEPTSRDKFDQQYGQAMEAPWDAAQSEELYAWYQTTAEARELFKKATSMGRCQLPILTGQPGVTFLAALIMPNLSGMRSLARLMVLEGHLLEQEGKEREAVEAYLAAFRAGGHLGREPILITGLVGIACQAIGSDAMMKCLARHEVPRQTLDWLAGRLGELEGSLPDRGARRDAARRDHRSGRGTRRILRTAARLHAEPGLPHPVAGPHAPQGFRPVLRWRRRAGADAALGHGGGNP